MKKIIFLTIFVLFAVALTGCNQQEEDKFRDPIFVVLEVEYHEQPIKLRLYPHVAPITVANFLDLVDSGYYDGVSFHRIIRGSLIQSGDGRPYGRPVRDPIFGEFTWNGFINNLRHERGVISMARNERDNNSATTEFFICQSDSPEFDRNFAAFGRVVSGMEVVDAINELSTDATNRPHRIIRILTARRVES
ncbi:MAG: peptidylprolyl isomerase [Erysipelotrichales bacterium]|nr:peptidylprolyl isomerase [Erysipelotrichales bacterium]